MAGGTVNNANIVGIARAVPQGVRTLEDEARIFGEKEMRRIGKWQ